MWPSAPLFDELLDLLHVQLLLSPVETLRGLLIARSRLGGLCLGQLGLALVDEGVLLVLILVLLRREMNYFRTSDAQINTSFSRARGMRLTSSSLAASAMSSMNWFRVLAFFFFFPPRS